MVVSTTSAAAAHARMTPAAAYILVHALARSTKTTDQGLKIALVVTLACVNKTCMC